MAWCPFARHRPLSETHTQGAIDPRAVILHTAVSGASSLFGFFEHNSVLESHFYVANDGTIEQYMDTRRRADANKNANDFAVSIETQDDRQIKPWTSAQVDALVRLVAWVCDTHGIPKRQIPTAYGSGIGWHVQFGAPGPWTPSAKTCPGGPRIEQTKAEIIPRVANGDDMPSSEEIAKAVWTYWIYNRRFKWKEYAETLLGSSEDRIIRQRIDPLRNEVAAIRKLLMDQSGLTADEVAEALAPKLVDEGLIAPIETAIERVMGKDNADQARQIVGELAKVLAEGTENTGGQGDE